MQTFFSANQRAQSQTVSVLPLKLFKFLAVKIESTTTGSQANCQRPQTQLNKFLIEMHEPGQHPHALHYWHERRATYDLSLIHI